MRGFSFKVQGSGLGRVGLLVIGLLGGVSSLFGSIVLRLRSLTCLDPEIPARVGLPPPLQVKRVGHFGVSFWAIL